VGAEAWPIICHWRIYVNGVQEKVTQGSTAEFIEVGN